jgi:hypothetical protein
MAIQTTNKVYQITASGGTILLPVEDIVSKETLLYVSGSITLSSSLTISNSGTAEENTYFKIIYPGSITKGANSVTIFGMSLSASQALIPAIFEVRYNGTSFNVWYLPASTTTVSSQIDDLALAQLVQQTGPGLIGRSAATLGDMSYQTLTNEGNVFSLFGTTLAGNQDYGVRLAKATLSSGQVLTLNTAPITVIAAPGAGKMINILSVATKLTFGTAAYAANTQLSLKYVGAAYNACTDASTLVSGASRTLRWDQVVSTTASATNTQMIENAGIQITVNTGNPTTGDSSVDYYIYYVITTL